MRAMSDTPTLGTCRHASPLEEVRFMSDDVRVLRDPHVRDGTSAPDSDEQAGPRKASLRSAG